MKETLEGYRLSPQQRDIWTAAGDLPAYQNQCAVLLSGRLDTGALRGSVARIVQRHEILRTTFHCLPGMDVPIQVIGTDANFAFRESGMAGPGASPIADQVARLMAAERAEGFDLSAGPVLKVLRCNTSTDEHLMILTVPAICSDLVGVRNIAREVVQELSDLSEDSEQDEVVQYADYAEWHNELLESDDASDGRRFWARTSLTNDEPEPSVEPDSPSESCFNSRQLLINPELTARIECSAIQQNVTEEVFLLACWQVLLWRRTRRTPQITGVFYGRRNYGGLQKAIGPFASYLPLRTDLEASYSFSDLLNYVDQNYQKADEWQDYFSAPEPTSLHEGGGRMRSFPITFEYQCLDEAGAEAGGLGFSFERDYSCQSRFSQRLSVARTGNSLSMTIDYDESLYTEFDADSLAEELLTVIQAVAANTRVRIGDPDVIGPVERSRLLEDFNLTARDYPDRKAIHQLVEEQGEIRPDAIAIEFEDEALTFEELNRRANQLARHLAGRGVGPDKVAGIALNRGLNMLVSVLAVWKAGGAYAAIDFTQPRHRLGRVVADSGAPIIIIDSDIDDVVKEAGAEPIDLAGHAARIAAESDRPLDREVEGRNLAYLIYTSGSTGNPKGVMIEHCSLSNLLWALEERIHRNEPGLRVSLNAPLAFDASVKQLIQLARGRTVVLIPEEVRREGPRMREYVVEKAIEVLDCTPSQMKLMREGGIGGSGNLRRVLIGGEAIDHETWAAMAEETEREYWNVYGPTECTVDSTAAKVSPKRRVTIGSGLGNVTAYVLDEDRRLVPFGGKGELAIGGAGVGRGYKDNPDRSAERYIPNPFASGAGERLYLSGDLVKLVDDGSIEYVGRIDQQVKVRGNRIELGEIEAALRDHESVKDAIAEVKQRSADDVVLVAYVVTRDESETSSELLRDHLRERLPEYMVPSAVVMMKALPLNRNGKVERRKLPDLDEVFGDAEQAGEAAGTPYEEILAGIWQEVLGLRRVSVDANFFEIGGHSLLATQMMSRVREAFGVEIPLRALFEEGNVRGLARRIEETKSSGAGVKAGPLERRSRDQEIPLSFAQQRLWFLDKLEPDNPFYNSPAGVRLEGTLDEQILERVLNEVMRRHEVLRTRFEDIDGQPRQVIEPDARMKITSIDLLDLEEDRRAEEAKRLGVEEATLPFDLRSGPVIRAKLIMVGESENLLLVTMHHIASDGWSLGLLIKEVAALYDAFVNNRESPLEELEIQYADFATWQRGWLQGEVLEQQLAYWRRKLGGGLPVLDLATDKPRPAVQRHNGAYHSFELSKELSESLKSSSRQQGTTLFMTLLAAFYTLLSRYTGQSDIALGSPIAGRNDSKTEKLIGFFINSLVLRADLSGDPTFKEVLGRVRDVVLDAHLHQDIPFEKLVDELQPDRSLSRSALFQATFVLQNTPWETVTVPGLKLSGLETTTSAAKFDVSMRMREAGDQLFGTVEYNTDLFEASTISRMVEHFQVLLLNVAGDIDRRISTIPLLSGQESRQILSQWNETEREYAGSGCLHELFERRVELTPDEVAVVFEDEVLTYDELDRRANQLAHHLQGSGVGSEVRVGICLERSLDMIVGLLGILKAGGAYVPMDPSYPAERLSFLLADARPSVILTDSRLADAISPQPAQIVRLDSDWEDIAQASDQKPITDLSPDNTAYVIYTSGSTGKPKGVMISHKGIVNRLLWGQEAYELNENDAVVQLASFCFDFSVWEIFAPLIAGSKLILPRPGEQQDITALVRLIAERRATIVHFIPTMLQFFVEHPELEQCGCLRIVFSGGEALMTSLQDRAQSRLSAELYNQYGPTEASVDVTFSACERGNSRPRASIGRPIANTRVYIVDGAIDPLPIHVPGELLIGGDGLARGYLNRPEITAEKFIPDPFSGIPGSRLYRSGDRARFLPSGEIDLLGRIDHQVKVRGFRIELSEIEAALLQHESVREAVVTATADGETGKRLVGYVVAADAVQISSPEMRAYLKEKLPDYMVPSTLVTLESLPLLPNGKVDRLALPSPDFTRMASERTRKAPRGQRERILAGIWEQVLGVAEVSMDDNFFELGGDSILSIQIISLANRAGLKLTPRQLFEHQTIAGLAAVAQTELGDAEEQGMVTGPVPLTPIQARFFERLDPNPHHFNQSVLVEPVADLEVEPMRRALSKVTEHHDALRLRYKQEETGAWRQEIVAANEQSLLVEIDLSGISGSAQDRDLQACANQIQDSLNIFDGPLLRAAVIGLGSSRGQRLLIVIHHLAVDGISWRIVLDDLQKAYEQSLQGREIDLGSKTTSFKRWSERLQVYARGEQLKGETSYWASRISAAARLPRDKNAGENTVSSVRVVTSSLTEQETRALLQAVPSIYRAQINEVILMALAEAIGEWSAVDRVPIEMEGHGREDIIEGIDLTRTVGWFTTRYPIEVDIAPGEETGAKLRRVKAEVRGVPNRGIGYGLLKYLGDDSDTSRILRDAAEPEVSFNYLGQMDQVLKEGGRFRAAREGSGSSRRDSASRRYSIEVNGGVLEGRLRINWKYSDNLHDQRTIQALAAKHVEILRDVVESSRHERQAWYIPGDFPLLNVSQEKLDEITGRDRDIEDIYPLSPMQQGMLFFALYAPNSGMYIEQSTCEFHGDLDSGALRQAWQQVVDRHPILRTSFVWESIDEPLQIVRRGVEMPFTEVDARNLSGSEQRKMLDEFLLADRSEGFDLSKAPLMRVILIRMEDSVYRFIWNHHHLLLDGWSAAAIRRELFSFYEAACRSEGLRLTAPRPYGDYIGWLKEQDLRDAESFWRATLREFTRPTRLAMDRDPGSAADPNDSRGHRRLRFSEETTSALQSFAQKHQLTMNTIVQGIWGLLLGSYSGTRDVVLGAAVSGRPPALAGVEQMIGLFMNAMPVRVRMRPDEKVADWLKDLQASQVESRQFEHTPLAQIQRWSEVQRGLALFETIFVFDNYPTQGVLEGRDKKVEILDYSSFEKTNYPLTVVVAPGATLGIRISYYLSRFDPLDIDRIVNHFDAVLTSVATKPDLHVRDLEEAIAESDRRQTAVRKKELEDASIKKMSRIRRKGVLANEAGGLQEVRL